jgi:hypothetical protein
MAVTLAGCATARIPNTDVPDTTFNRGVIGFCERYRRAVETRDARALLALASPRYFEDGGTPRGDDDYGYDGLQRLLGAWSDEVRQVRYEIRYRRVQLDPEHPDRVRVDFTFSGSYTLRRPTLDPPRPGASLALAIDPVREATPVAVDDELWFRRVADNRLELERVGDDWRILSGM